MKRGGYNLPLSRILLIIFTLFILYIMYLILSGKLEIFKKLGGA